MTAKVIEFPPRLHQKVVNDLVKAYNKAIEVFKCTECGSTDNFRLHTDGGVMCAACNIWQPLGVFEPNEKEK